MRLKQLVRTSIGNWSKDRHQEAQGRAIHRQATISRLSKTRTQYLDVIDGLDMSAIREVKFLQELQHPNVIEVSPYLPPTDAEPL